VKEHPIGGGSFPMSQKRRRGRKREKGAGFEEGSMRGLMKLAVHADDEGEGSYMPDPAVGGEVIKILFTKTRMEKTLRK